MTTGEIIAALLLVFGFFSILFGLIYLQSVEARKAYEQGQESEWIELNRAPGQQFYIWAYYLVAWWVGAKCERSERIGINGASGLVIQNFRYKLLRFVPKTK